MGLFCCILALLFKLNLLIKKMVNLKSALRQQIQIHVVQCGYLQSSLGNCPLLILAVLIYGCSLILIDLNMDPIDFIINGVNNITL